METNTAGIGNTFGVTGYGVSDVFTPITNEYALRFNMLTLAHNIVYNNTMLNAQKGEYNTYNVSTVIETASTLTKFVYDTQIAAD
jgi:hypothetical protein